MFFRNITNNTHPSQTKTILAKFSKTTTFSFIVSTLTNKKFTVVPGRQTPIIKLPRQEIKDPPTKISPQKLLVFFLSR